VLVADDNAVNLKVACAMLLKLGYAVRTAVDGREAVEAVARAAARPGEPAIDAILMDVNMPEVDGLEATRQIHAAFGNQAPPIIAVTAGASDEDRLRCEAAGMDDYLTKPLQVAALAQTLEKWLVTGPAQARAEQAAAASGDDHVLDLARLEEFREYDDEALTMTREVVSLFLTDTPARLEGVAAAIATGDAQALATAAHALKGSAGNVGAVALQRQASELEALAKSGFPADAPERAAALQATWELTQARMQGWLERQS